MSNMTPAEEWIAAIARDRSLPNVDWIRGIQADARASMEEQVRQAREEGYRRGAEEMREEASLCLPEYDAGLLADPPGGQSNEYWRDVIRSYLGSADAFYREAIMAMPLPTPAPGDEIEGDEK